MTVKPIPEGYPQVTPYLCVDGASAAIEFYGTVFGATERMRMPEPDGKIGQAELRIGDSLIMLSDEYPELGVRSPARPQDSRRHVGDDQRLRQDVDDVFDRALQAGARVLRPIQDQFYGDRSGNV